MTKVEFEKLSDLEVPMVLEAICKELNITVERQVVSTEDAIYGTFTAKRNPRSSFILEYDNEEDAKLAIDGRKAHDCISQIQNDVFRPARKHGYRNQRIAALVNKIGDDAEELIGMLEQEFMEIVSDLNWRL